MVPDDSNLQRSARLAASYSRYRAEFDARPIGGRFMPYRWWTLPDPMSGFWMIYSGMLSDYASDLANSINDLTHHVHRLRCWASVVGSMSDDEKLEVAHEFVGMLGIAALGAPYAIKSRFAVAAANLCHQANAAKDMAGWADEFPSKNLYLNDVDPFGRGWSRYRGFKRKVEPIAGTAFKAQSHDFRNAYNHGFSPRLLLGITSTVKRLVDPETKRPSYAIGGAPPLDLSLMADLLEAECRLCYAAFEAFQQLVEEQTEAIMAFEVAHRSPGDAQPKC